MSGYTLTWKTHGPPSLADGAMIRPDTLGMMEADKLRAVRLNVGSQTVPLGDLFDVSGTPGDTLTLRGAPPLPRLGAKMTSGTLLIEGDAGDGLGASMRGGLIRVSGKAGHRVGGPDYTTERGMTGGEIVVAGDTGDYAGLRMRRGMIVITGSAGKSPGFRMLAGTLVIARGTLDAPGLEMRRGTIVSLDATSPPAQCPWLVEEGTFPASSLTAYLLLVARLRALGASGESGATERLMLSSGDRFELGKGELWQRRS